ncbi:MAG TPA: ATP-dependent DNA helicase, partial [Paludibacter sp.]|nr:ATP-dependent DNA helicase [Paludibacter sp.]
FSKPVFKERTELPVTPKRLVKVGTSGGDKTPIQNGSIPTGAFVKHSIFGIGKVLETSISNGNEKADIDFGEKGVKSLLLKFAKLEVLK